MKYKSPKVDGKNQWVPIVAKNRDWLVGYISGIQMIESVISNSLEENGIELDFRGLDICLDSSRFNDIMEDGRKESECTDNEIKKYYENIIEEKIDMIKEIHPDNNISDDFFLSVECSCGFGFYNFKKSEDIPKKQFLCGICGKVVIDYTNKDDSYFEYDGNSNIRLSLIAEEIAKKLDECNKEDDEDIF